MRRREPLATVEPPVAGRVVERLPDEGKQDAALFEAGRHPEHLHPGLEQGRAGGQGEGGEVGGEPRLAGTTGPASGRNLHVISEGAGEPSTMEG